MTLAELAIHIPASIEMFEKYNFNYYQNGSQKFSDFIFKKKYYLNLKNKIIRIINK